MSLECEINIFAFKDPGVQITAGFFIFLSQLKFYFPPPPFIFISIFNF